jgi:membrane protein implicated in regulation of membrane protease activity
VIVIMIGVTGLLKLGRLDWPVVVAMLLITAVLYWAIYNRARKSGETDHQLKTPDTIV